MENEFCSVKEINRYKKNLSWDELSRLYPQAYSS
jgi:hypothetical protein